MLILHLRYVSMLLLFLLLGCGNSGNTAKYEKEIFGTGTVTTQTATPPGITGLWRGVSANPNDIFAFTRDGHYLVTGISGSCYQEGTYSHSGANFSYAVTEFACTNYGFGTTGVTTVVGSQGSFPITVTDAILTLFDTYTAARQSTAPTTSLVGLWRSSNDIIAFTLDGHYKVHNISGNCYQAGTYKSNSASFSYTVSELMGGACTDYGFGTTGVTTVVGTQGTLPIELTDTNLTIFSTFTFVRQ